MSTFDKTKAEAEKKAGETKGLGQEKAGQAQAQAKVHCMLDHIGIFRYGRIEC